MDENLEMLIKDNIVGKLCGNNMDCHDLIGTWPISILKLILENLILLIDEYINSNEVI